MASAKVKQTETAARIGTADRAYAGRPNPSDENGQTLLTPSEVAAYLRVSKSYLDKLRVYGGGPQFLRPGRRKILYRKSDLDLWLAARRFGSTSEYANDWICLQHAPLSNIKQQHPTKTLRHNSN
jgi:excisionase family DNA binding protein